MPFGAEIGSNGVRFSLWAPAARRVELCLERPEGRRALEMSPVGDGWYQLRCAEAGAGSRYHYRIDGGIEVPDPASRYQPEGVHGSSEVIDPTAWQWEEAGWQGRPWRETILYELHVGCFSPEGSFDGVVRRLPHLSSLGITAIELMPIAAFPGRRNWGYDGVLPFAPAAPYGSPERLKALVEAAHRCGIMVFLDVVYNHFGPEGNYLHRYAPLFFTRRHPTPWGDGINFDGPGSGPVRRFFIHNALYWLEEYRLDGLRLDAVHAIADDSQPALLSELAERVAAGPGRERHIHLVLENDKNEARYLGAGGYTAQWNDDYHHACHVLATGERQRYYQDYADAPLHHLIRTLTSGFAFQGERSPWRDNAPRGEPSGHLPPDAFVTFLQNHDQIGNRAFGERLPTLCGTAPLHPLTALLLLAPHPPLLFMGQEWNSHRPFLFFCDFEPELAEAVRRGRRQEFARFPQFRDQQQQARIPDPASSATFSASLLDWPTAEQAAGKGWLALYRRLITLRRQRIVPHMRDRPARLLVAAHRGPGELQLRWQLGSGAQLSLTANLSETTGLALRPPAGAPLFAWPSPERGRTCMPPWSLTCHLFDAAGGCITPPEDE